MKVDCPESEIPPSRLWDENRRPARGPKRLGKFLRSGSSVFLRDERVRREGQIMMPAMQADR